MAMRLQSRPESLSRAACDVVFLAVYGREKLQTFRFLKVAQLSV
jgi:hypothetical protein